MAANIPLSKLAVPDVFNLASRHIQFIRSIPSKSLLTTVVGMKQPDHIRANLEVIKKAPMSRQEFFDVIKPIRRQEYIEEALTDY